MKKLVFASVLALASFGYVAAPMLRAQDSITIKDPQEFNAYQLANTQSDPKAKATQLEAFLQSYPQSVVKSAVLDTLIDTYQSLNDADKTLTAAGRLLQVDPNNMKAIFISVFIKKNQCAKSVDPKTGKSTSPQTCDDAAILAQKGLDAKKPAATSDDEWKKLTGGTYTTFHSSIALDDIVSKGDPKAGIDEYRKELMLYSADDTTKGPGLWDTLQLAETYTKLETIDAKAAREAALKAKAAPTDADAKTAAKAAKDTDGNDLVQAVWFYARAWNFAPASLKTPIEGKMKFYYTKYHGNVEGLDAVKTSAAATLFPPGSLTIAAAKTPAEVVHDLMVTTSDLNTLALSDKEYILANGDPEDADKLWAIMKGKATPVPGEVIEATASVIQLAVSPDAKNATPKYADFIVNLKTPLTEKEVPPAATFVYGIAPAAELDGTYDSYTQVAATDTRDQTAQIVLKDGAIVPAKKTAPAHHPAAKPAAGHHSAAH